MKNKKGAILLNAILLSSVMMVVLANFVIMFFLHQDYLFNLRIMTNLKKEYSRTHSSIIGILQSNPSSKFLEILQQGSVTSNIAIAKGKNEIEDYVTQNKTNEYSFSNNDFVMPQNSRPTAIEIDKINGDGILNVIHYKINEANIVIGTDYKTINNNELLEITLLNPPDEERRITNKIIIHTDSEEKIQYRISAKDDAKVIPEDNINIKLEFYNRSKDTILNNVSYAKNTVYNLSSKRENYFSLEDLKNDDNITFEICPNGGECDDSINIPIKPDNFSISPAREFDSETIGDISNYEFNTSADLNFDIRFKITEFNDNDKIEIKDDNGGILFTLIRKKMSVYINDFDEEYDPICTENSDDEISTNLVLIAGYNTGIIEGFYRTNDNFCLEKDNLQKILIENLSDNFWIRFRKTNDKLSLFICTDNDENNCNWRKIEFANKRDNNFNNGEYTLNVSENVSIQYARVSTFGGENDYLSYTKDINFQKALKITKVEFYGKTYANNDCKVSINEENFQSGLTFNVPEGRYIEKNAINVNLKCKAYTGDDAPLLDIEDIFNIYGFKVFYEI